MPIRTPGTLARGEKFLLSARQALLDYPALVGKPGDWRWGVAAAYVRFLVWINPLTEIPTECRSEFSRIVGFISIASASIPGFNVENRTAIEDLATALSAEDAHQLANDIVALRRSVLDAMSSWRA